MVNKICDLKLTEMKNEEQTKRKDERAREGRSTNVSYEQEFILISVEISSHAYSQARRTA
jgi:hypothetical protein